MRGSSYSDLLKETTHSLFDDASIDGHLRQASGFGAREAIAVLDGLHELQVANMNRRQRVAALTYDRVTSNHVVGLATDAAVADATRRIDRAMQPDEIAASVAVVDLARSTGLSESVVGAVLDAFTWRPSPEASVDDAVGRFLRGDNPLRSAPVLRTDSGRALLVPPCVDSGGSEGTTRGHSPYHRRLGAVPSTSRPTPRAAHSQVVRETHAVGTRVACLPVLHTRQR